MDFVWGLFGNGELSGTEWDNKGFAWLFACRKDVIMIIAASVE